MATALKTIADFAAQGYRAAPWSTIAAILGGWLLNGFLHGLLDKALSAATDKYLLYWSNHFKLYMFLAGKGMLIGNLMASTLVGAVVGFATRGREMFATITLSLVLGAMAAIGYLVMVVIGQGRHNLSLGRGMALRRCVRNRPWRSCCSDEQDTPPTRRVRCAIARRIVGSSTILAQKTQLSHTFRCGLIWRRAYGPTILVTDGRRKPEECGAYFGDQELCPRTAAPTIVVYPLIGWHAP